jgi:hypothetical protein
MNNNKSMSGFQDAIFALDALGSQLTNYISHLNTTTKTHSLLADAVKLAPIHNAWFTKEHCEAALRDWGQLLQKDNLSSWLSGYPDPKETEQVVGLVLAGNLPLVGLHDVLSVLISGHKAKIKMSSKDNILLPALLDILFDIYPHWASRVSLISDQLGSVDKVIATWSNNSSRYFSYYFSDKPHIIRRNRNSVAVLDGKETADQLQGLSNDICRYFGLGCRSVSKLWVPRGYDFDILFGALYQHRSMINHNAYANNYDYNKAIFLMNQEPLLDNGFVILKEDDQLSSPIACLYYSYYDKHSEVEKAIESQQENIQCVVTNSKVENAVAMGKAQSPKLDDYADNVDTLAFLLKN